MKNEECNKAELDIYPKITLEIVDKVIDDIPDYILSENIKKLYKESFRFGVLNVLKPVYEKLIRIESEKN